MENWENYLENNKSRFLDEMLDFVRIPSISALSEHAGDIQRGRRMGCRPHERRRH